VAALQFETLMENPEGPASSLPTGYRSPSPAPVPTLVEWAHEHLLSMLVSGEIAPGTRVGIDAIARKLGISQTPIREALSRLEAEKLVVKVPNVGYHATTQMTPSEVSDLFVLRLLVEPYAAARAAEALDDAGIARLTQIAAEIDRAGPETPVTYARFAETDATLHCLIAQASGNALIAETITRLHMHLHIFRFVFSAGGPEEAPEEHREIIRALLARDAVAAEAAMRTHLEQSHARIEKASLHIATEATASKR
jgi:DNA-binding GntR family transcriptional regulator